MAGYDTLINKDYLNNGLSDLGAAIRAKGETTAQFYSFNEMVAAVNAIEKASYGYILVNFPTTASQLACLHNGSDLITISDTNVLAQGSYIFLIPTPVADDTSQDYVIRLQATTTEEQLITLSQKGQSVFVQFNKNLGILYDNGTDTMSSEVGGWTFSGCYTDNSTSILLGKTITTAEDGSTTETAGIGSMETTNYIDLTNYYMLSISTDQDSGFGIEGAVYLFSESDTATTNTATVMFDSAGATAIDVNDLTGKYKVKITSTTDTTGYYNFSVSKVMLYGQNS